MSGGTEAVVHKHLSVLNRTGPSSASHYLLEDPGAHPEEPRPAETPIETLVIAALRKVYDPEIPLNIYDLGLIYKATVDEAGRAEIAMTLTSPGCPVAGDLVRQVHEQVRQVPSLTWVRTEIVWDPPWSKDRMSDAAKLAVGML
jgi:FeS assembly SUF system protein